MQTPRTAVRLRALLVSVALLAGVSVVTVDGASAARPAPVRRGLDSSDPRATDQIIVRLKDGTAPSVFDLSQAAGENVRLRRQLRHGAWVSKLSGRRSPADAAAIAARIAALPGVAYAEPDAILFPSATPTDPLWSQQWDLTAPVANSFGANLPAAWDITKGTSDVVVAVIDTGITAHADLAGQTVPGYDFISNTSVANDGSLRDADPSDTGDWITAADARTATFAGCTVGNSSWHGTHVAGTIAAVADNGIGVSGIAPGVKVLPVRVLGKCGGFTSDIVDGMRWAAGLAVPGVPTNPNPAAIENLSLGGVGACSVTQQQAIDDIVAVGTTVVVAAGNANIDAVNSNPANCANVVTVAATGSTGSRSWYSNFGSLVEIAAPGGDDTLTPGFILSTLNAGTTVPTTDTYAGYEGTSMATPHVVAVAALVKSVQPGITPDALNTLLRSTVTPFPAGSTCTLALCGPGILNAGAAVAAASAANGPRVLGAFSKTAPAAGTTGIAASTTLTWTPSAGATNYEYCLVSGITVREITTPCTNWVSTGSATSVIVSGLTLGAVYAWQVRASDGTHTAEANVSVRSTFTTVTPAGAFAKTAPANAATGLAVTTALSWGASTGATSYEVCADSTINGTCDGTWTSTGVARTASLTGLLNSTRYEWQVRSVNAAGLTTLANTGTWWTFTTVAATPPGAFNKTAPANLATGQSLTVALTWGASSGVLRYEYCQDSTVNSTCDGVWTSTGTARTVTPAGRVNGTRYEWQVRSVNAAGLTTLANTGAWWTFTTI